MLAQVGAPDSCQRQRSSLFWSADSRQIAFVAGGLDLNAGGERWGFYGVSPDGQQFLVNQRGAGAVTPIMPIVNWLAGLREQ